MTNICLYCRNSGYLVVLFIISKLFYIGNVIAQFLCLNLVLATKYHTFGIDMAHNMLLNKDWTDESYVAFPRVTLCDFKVRGQDMGNVHEYTVQCVLPVNHYNEAIYVFLWYWMALVIAISIQRFDNRHSSSSLVVSTCLLYNRFLALSFSCFLCSLQALLSSAVFLKTA